MATHADLETPLSPDEIAAARRRVAGAAVRTPLLKGEGPTWLKLECLQPHGSYKIRSATNAVKARLEAEGKLRSIVSASAGNFGQAVVAAARGLGLPSVIHVPDNAARVKVERLKELGAQVREHSFDEWWRIMSTRETGDDGDFFHPVCDRNVIAGAATIGEEIAEDLPEFDALFVPIGGGGLLSGLAQSLRLRKLRCKIVAVEAETATPLLAARKAGGPVKVERRPSFIDGMGSTRILDEMWPLLRKLVDDVVVVSLAEIESAIRRLASQQHVIAEGAGAAAYAAALRAGAGAGRSVAIVSGGNLDLSEFRRITEAR